MASLPLPLARLNSQPSATCCATPPPHGLACTHLSNLRGAHSTRVANMLPLPFRWGSCRASVRSGNIVRSSSGQEVVGVEADDAKEAKTWQSAPAVAVPVEIPRGNVGLALASTAVAVALFAFTRLSGVVGGGADLSSLAISAVPYDVALSNGRPTVIEFYADWCEVCRQMAPDVALVERIFSDSVNFVMINIDNPKWAQEIEEFGVDGIPHFTFLDSQANEEAYIVGKLPRSVMKENLTALVQGGIPLPHSQVMGEFSSAAERRDPAAVQPLSHGA
eukprot:TRINITY_DN9645_c0_g1_i3.p1 TRINITY_DN9645_c0_g1~~TRINITY_DN9645_c0_g1_i3.p1  ORF type:complete len:285 (+),score=54.46 TRINITY_DN9645_c0_g1_i3:27-857(+)